MRSSIFFFSFLFVTITSALSTNPALDSARSLAQQGIIVDQSSIAQQYPVNSSLDTQESNMYRLGDTLIRQEAINIALKIRGIDIPTAYLCRGYFLDLPEDWVCRVVEFAADYAIVTRANTRFRPHDSLTLAESLKILMVSLQIPLTNSDTSIIPGTFPDWQKRIVLTLREKNITFVLYDNQGNIVARMSDSEALNMSIGIPLSHNMTRGEFFQLVTVLRNSDSNSDPTAHCTIYNDGCNDCTLNNSVTACTQRECFWKGIPSCSACENGYTLQNNRCVKAQGTCMKEGESVGNLSLPPAYQTQGTCCAGLTSVGSKDMLVGAPNICVNMGDGYCDTRYESVNNSSDCHTLSTLDTTLCQSYYDGCNSCSRTSNGQTICTMMACIGAVRPSYCTSYISYVPINQSQDNTFLGKILTEIQNYAQDLSCTTTSQCHWKLFGNNSCGGSSVGVKYSTKNVNEILFTDKTTYYTDAQQLYNQMYPVFSPCAMMSSPAPLACTNGLCQ